MVKFSPPENFPPRKLGQTGLRSKPMAQASPASAPPFCLTFNTRRQDCARAGAKRGEGSRGRGVLAGNHSSLGWQTGRGRGGPKDQSLSLLGSRATEDTRGCQSSLLGKGRQASSLASACLGAEPAQIPAGKGAGRWSSQPAEPSRGQVWSGSESSRRLAR